MANDLVSAQNAPETETVPGVQAMARAQADRTSDPSALRFRDSAIDQGDLAMRTAPIGAIVLVGAIALVAQTGGTISTITCAIETAGAIAGTTTIAIGMSGINTTIGIAIGITAIGMDIGMFGHDAIGTAIRSLRHSD